MKEYTLLWPVSSPLVPFRVFQYSRGRETTCGQWTVGDEIRDPVLLLGAVGT